MASPRLGPAHSGTFSLYPAGWVGTRPDDRAKAALAVVDAGAGWGPATDSRCSGGRAGGSGWARRERVRRWLGGLSFLSLAGTIAFGSFKYATFDCGSVISPKDPTNRVARTAAIPPRRLAARNHCADMRSSRAARLVVMMGIGVAMIFVFLATPTLARRAERRGARRRRRA